MRCKIGAFLLGGVVGAVVGILLAPRSGEETRTMIADKANDVWGEAQEWGSQASAAAQRAYKNAAAKGQEVVSELTSKGQEVVQAATGKIQEAAGNVKPVFEEKNDELRDKIDAARQRIAAQVAKNAQESTDQAIDADAKDDSAAPAADQA